MNQQKVDFKKELKYLYNPSKKAPAIVEVPQLNYLMIDGQGTPGECQAYKDAIPALFGLSYGIKFKLKKEQGFDYTVMPLEGLWWADNMQDFVDGNKEKWQWTLMIMQPDQINQEIFNIVKEQVKKKKDLPAIDLLRLEKYTEGPSAQIMHIGPYSEEHENIMKIHNYIIENNGAFNGHKHKHHEIYLSDFRKTAPEKLKTVLRQPFVYQK